MRILLIEDEELAGQRLQEFILKSIADAEIVGWEKSIRTAMSWFRNNEMPDLIFSDIELLDGNAFQLYEQIQVTCPIIFATAYDQYLLEAFQINGIAYLLKPYDEEQFRDALQKYQRLFQKETATELNAAIVAQLQDALRPSFEQYKERFTIKKSNGIFILQTGEIEYIAADGNLVFAFDKKGKRHPLSYKLSDLEKLLNPRDFFRINRSEIIQLNSIRKMESYFNDRLAIHIEHHEKALICSASRTASFRRWVEGE